MSKGGKPDLQDKKSAFAASFNAAAAIVAASTSKGKLNINDVVDAVIDLQVALYGARIAATKELELGGPGQAKDSGGSSSGRSGGSKTNSAQSGSPGSPTDNQTEYYSDIADRVAADGGKLKPGLNKFKALSYAKAKAALEAAIAIDPGK